ncbi:inactive heme oxygenase 2 [Dionaea muscipula]
MAVLQWRPLPASPSPTPNLSLRTTPPPSNFLVAKIPSNNRSRYQNPVSCSSSSDEPTSVDPETSDSPHPPPSSTGLTPEALPRLPRKRVRYRKVHPGENKGITEELRFVAMRLRNNKASLGSATADGPAKDSASQDDGEGEGRGPFPAGVWEPTVEGFLSYLVDSKLVFETLERIVEESDDVSYAFIRKTGLERSSSLSMDLQWFSQKSMVIPEPTNAGLSYANYLEQLAQTSVPLFLCHLYTIYFSHISGDQVIVRQVAEKLLDGRALELNRYDDDPRVLLKNVRDNINKLAEHWSRVDKNKCLKESAKSYTFWGQIVLLIVSINKRPSRRTMV